jgi:hypothetical protein
MAEELQWSGLSVPVRPMGKTILTILMIGLLSVPGVARDRHSDSWDNLYQLIAGQAVEVKESNVKVEKGIFVGFADRLLLSTPNNRTLFRREHKFRKFDYVPGARAAIPGLGPVSKRPPV